LIDCMSEQMQQQLLDDCSWTISAVGPSAAFHQSTPSQPRL